MCAGVFLGKESLNRQSGAKLGGKHIMKKINFQSTSASASIHLFLLQPVCPRPSAWGQQFKSNSGYTAWKLGRFKGRGAEWKSNLVGAKVLNVGRSLQTVITLAASSGKQSLKAFCSWQQGVSLSLTEIHTHTVLRKKSDITSNILYIISMSITFPKKEIVQTR